ncbi:MAG: hypothetical protein CME06_09635 [Gemmatimonadetes bacterium]|nr:hypothetical protein [Gemmatimonadota bacterium]
MAALIYYLGLACLFTHELDAVIHAEWRLLFILRNMPNDSAASLFVALHIPLFFGVLWLSNHRRKSVRNLTRLSVAAFLTVHALLHFSLSSNPAYEFHGTLSLILILSAAVCGIAYLSARGRSFLRAPSRWELRRREQA